LAPTDKNPTRTTFVLDREAAVDMDDDLDVLRAVLVETPPDPERKERARARLLATIAAEMHDGTAPPSLVSVRVRRRRTTTRRAAAAIVVAAAVATVAVLLPSMSRTPAANASATLLALAEVAGLNGWESPGDGQFIYARSSGERADCGGGSCILHGFERERWVGSDGSGRIVETAGGRTSDEAFEGGQLPFFDGRTWLGLDREALRQEVADLADQEDPTEFTLFVQIGRLMGETELLPEMRIALFELAATFRGTVKLEAPVDALGRSGVGVGFVSGGIRYEILFDEDSALVLEERVVALRPEAEPIRVGGNPRGWLVPGSRTTYEASGLVPSPTARIDD
jgi:hypothetical protein